jgi:hypothetical protein
MRCLGRAISLVVILLILAAGWLYRDELQRWIRGVEDPMAQARRNGEASPTARSSGNRKIASLAVAHADSVVLNASETAAVLLDGLGWQEGAIIDSVHLELGDGTVRLSGQLLTSTLTNAVREYVKLPLKSREPVMLSGQLNPVHAGIAEWRLEHVSIHGIPLPADLAGRVLGEVGVKADGGRLQMILPQGVGGFRVHPEGMTLYAGGR